MTSTTVGELVERLTRRHTCRMGDEISTHHLKNPDGPEAAKLISSLQKEIDIWREAAREFRLGEPTARQQLLDALAKAEGAA